ncbi:phytoene desaturase family protein [Paenarthrobacter ilicis]|uniref:Pyridine nucleotide-disulfide oxidoreductase domain-containing protein 2 n=1 Tax=Paenarthrobacter ilicis TaxID=43665 RepID=A0ABX0TJJ4_9MICC|nr:NAD(P)/FAD-dependent oxidoreductase [Paenarthrobacter ilicis]MBM7791420.1 phytoene dehydrogenase-like protein [Paenarthrobacter ilicis]NIJ02689.1 phytoene dehydrogenase-like protein [Paenarthrobacter ilicis]
MVDVAVVGAGPNGLAAAVVMARAGLDVHVYEAGTAIGGGTRTTELIEPGYFHDVCSAVHPMAVASPFFKQFELSRRVELRLPEVQHGTPLDAGGAALAFQSLERTAEGLGADGPAYQRLMEPLLKHVDGVVDFTSNQLLRVPRDPLAAIRFGLATLEQGTPLWNRRFGSEAAQALLTGVMAHAVSALPSLSATGAGLLLNVLAHAGGWVIPVGGSASIAAAMAEDVEAHGGSIHVGQRVDSLDQVRPAKAILLDVAPPTLARLGGAEVPDRYRKSLETFRFGNAACKVDYILSGPVPWRAPGLAGAGTVHVGGSRASIAYAENQVAAGKHPDHPYVLVSQPSVVDASRAPEGRHILWTYCHVPAGSDVDMAEAVTARIERYAPGFRDVVVASKTTTAEQLSAYNENYVGGDFSAGLVDLRGLLQRPVVSPAPWRTPLSGVYLCSSSTPPGPGVTGMPGYHAATHALKDIFRIPVPGLGIGL